MTPERTFRQTEPAVTHRTLASVADELRGLDAAGLRRRLRVVGRTGSEADCGGRRVVVLCANDYLGLAADARLVAAAAETAAAEGAGAGAARLVSGTRPCHAALEDDVARFAGSEAALTFASGYAGNVSVLQALLGDGDLAVSDAMNHASLIDGLRLSRATRRVVPHGDVGAVRAALRDRGAFRRAAVVVEGLHSMDGDVPPLAELTALARDHDALIVIDDAHGTGVLGATGRGAIEDAGIAAAPDVVRLGTFGKAFGAAGAFVAASRDVCDLVIHRGRGFVFSTAPAPSVAGAARAGLRISQDEPWRRERCLALADRLRERLRSAGCCVPALRGPIVSVVVGDPLRAVDASRRLLDEHALLVPAIRPPTVPEGTSRLRLTTTAAHAESDVDRAADAVAEVLR